MKRYGDLLADIKTRIRQAIAQGWSRDTLALMIKTHTYDRQGAAVTNFDIRLQEPHAILAKNTLKTDNPTIGLILCQDKKRVLAEYALRGMNKPIGISEYELTRALPEEFRSALPTIEEIEAELSADLHDENEESV